MARDSVKNAGEPASLSSGNGILRLTVWTTPGAEEREIDGAGLCQLVSAGMLPATAVVGMNAATAARLIDEDERLELIKEPSLSVVLFRRRGWTDEQYNSWFFENHKKGLALVAPTKWRSGGKVETVTRFCFINPDTTEDDIKMILDSM